MTRKKLLDRYVEWLISLIGFMYGGFVAVDVRLIDHASYVK